MRQSPIVSRPMSDSDSWEGATAIADDIAEEVIEETNPGEMPEPPAPPKKKQSATNLSAAGAKR